MSHSSSALEHELAAEQAHVDLVYAHLEKAARSARQAAAQGRSIFASNRERYVREEDGTALFERDAFAFQAAKRLAVLDAEHEGLVFGRLDLADSEIRYIGRIGVRDEEYEPLVIDWRARAAEPFYRATATDPMDVVRRRVLRCRNDRVTGIEDDLLDGSADTDLVIIGEGALMAALKRARGRQMRDIVSTIQAEQDEAIRAEYQGVTMISGGPGTGKTVVALHRAAYLLYSNRRRFERGGILVVGPSPVFMNYIERVLPSLGEDSVTLRSIGGVAVDVLGFSADRVDGRAAAAIKGSLRMVPLLKRLVELPVVDAGPEGLRLRLSVKGEVLTLDDAALRRIRHEALRHHRLNRARATAEKGLVNALWERLPEDHTLDRDAFEELATDTAAYRMFVNAWWPNLTATDALARLADESVAARVGSGLLSPDEVRALSRSYRPTSDETNPWTVADVALLDELVSQLGPIEVEDDTDQPIFLPDGTEMSELITTADLLSHQREVDPDADPQDTYAHLLVDEAQDITPMQWRMLRRRGPQSSWTIVGDAAQSSWPHPAETAEAITALVGSGPRRTFRLSVNYRSPAEVFNLAADVVREAVPDADLPEAVRSTGVEPLLLECARVDLEGTLRGQVVALLAEVQGTVGVIAPPSLIEDVSRMLTGLDEPERLVAVTPLQAKGLEYDGVVVVSPDDVAAEAPGGIRVLYVALTRPTQRLVTLDLDGRGAWRPEGR